MYNFIRDAGFASYTSEAKNEQSIFNNQGAHTYNFMPIPAARNT